LEKCEKVKSERELKAEIESLSTDNILETKKRNASSAAPISEDAEEIADEVEVKIWTEHMHWKGSNALYQEAKKNDLDLSFLGDQSSDSD
jgi:hypothetical protein